MEIAIIGAGIGGLTTGLALKKAGIDFKIYESASEIKAVGAGIMLGINAMQVYRNLGIDKKIELKGYKIHEMNIVNPNFNMLSKGSLNIFEEQFRLSNIAIHRSDLHHIISKEIGLDAIILNKKLSKISKESENYKLVFEDGTQTEAPFVIAADGINSTVRNTLFNENELRNAKQICWRGIVEFDVPQKFDHKLTESWAKGKRFGFTQISKNKIYWYLLINEDLGNLKSESINFADGFHPLVKEIIVSTPKENIHIARLFDLKPINQWNLENLCLLGDAAHATTPNLGQGACQAIEDAYILGELLKKFSLQEAIKKYPEIRKEKANYIVNTSWKIGKLAQINNVLGVAIRNFIMKLTPENISKKQFSKIFELDKF